MRHTRCFLLTIVMAVAAMTMRAQTANTITIPDMTAQIGLAQLPVNVDNSTDVTALQFDITLPEGMSVASDETTGSYVATLTNRSADHASTINEIGNQVYRVVLFSPTNTPIRGQSGTLLYLPVSIDDTVEEGAALAITVDNAVMSQATGQNVLNGVSAGTVNITKLPDLTATALAFSKSDFMPGEQVTASWQVANIGALDTGDGWTEQLSLVSNDGLVTKLIATIRHDKPLAAGAVVSRQADIVVPTLLGIDGEARLLLTIVPGELTGESQTARANNTVLSNDTYNIGKVLSLLLTPARVEEGSGQRITARLSRSGHWDLGEAFTLGATSDSRISVPQTVTIASGQSARLFYLTVADNDVLDADSIVTITAQGNGYEAVSQRLVIEDNELPVLTLTASKSDIAEGETFQLTVTASRPSTDPIVVTLSCENARRFTFPAQATIPAGESSVTVDVRANDDEVPGEQQTVAFIASAQYYEKSEALVVLTDDDMPVLELTLTPSTVQEDAGVTAVTGHLRRTTNTDSKITVRLSDDANGALYFGNQSLELAKGVEDVYFSFGPVDNALVDGDHTYTVTAAVWLSSCSCSAVGESAGTVSAQLTVLDNDGPALSLAASSATIKEGETTIVTVSRNTSYNVPLTLHLTSDYDDMLDYDHHVVIPAGESSVSVEIVSKGNDVQNDTHIAVFTVEADGFAKGTCWVMITDQTLPDARIASASLNCDEVMIGERVTLSLVVQNVGVADLPSGTVVKIYRKDDAESPVSTILTANLLASGEEETITKDFSVPKTVGSYSYYATVNESHQFQELSFANNASAEVTVSVKSPFNGEVSVDKTICMQGENVHIEGSLYGEEIANATVELYVINDGVRQTFTLQTDNQGHFSMDLCPFDSQSGHFVLGVCCPGEGLVQEMASFDKYGLRRAEQSNIICDVTRGEPFTGTIVIENPGVLQLSGVQAELVSSDNCVCSFDLPETIAGGDQVELKYSLTGLAATAGNTWENRSIRITTAEGVTLSIPIYYYCRIAEAKMMVSTRNIKTNVNQNGTTEYMMSVTNIGRGETGAISLALPSWIKAVTGTTLPSIAQNDTAYFALRFVPTSSMQLNVPVTGTIGLNCEHGDGIAINYNVIPVSESTGELIVDVCDEYTYYTADAPHLSGAGVLVRQPQTNAIVAQGITGDDGLFTIELPEGYYTIDVTSEKHSSFTTNVLVSPNDVNKVTVDLSVQAVTVSWDVEEIEIKDEYLINTTVVYETNVPRPVIKSVFPEKLPLEDHVFSFVSTNVGLINAENVYVSFPEIEGWKFELLSDNDHRSLAPQESRMFTCRLRSTDTAGSRGPRRGSIFGCIAGAIGVYYVWYCGLDGKMHKDSIDNGTFDTSTSNLGADMGNYAWGECSTMFMGIGAGNGNSSIFEPNGSGHNLIDPLDYFQEGVGIERSCRDCEDKFKDTFRDCFLDLLPGSRAMEKVAKKGLAGYVGDKVKDHLGGCAKETAANALYKSARDVMNDAKDCMKGPFDGGNPAEEYTKDQMPCWMKLADPCDRLPDYVQNMDKRKRAPASSAYGDLPGYMQSFIDLIPALIDYDEMCRNYYLYFFGDEQWFESTEPAKELLPFLNILVGDEVPLELAIENKPSWVSNETVKKFVDRWNNTCRLSRGEEVDGDVFESERLLEILQPWDELEAMAIDNGFLTFHDYAVDCMEKVVEGMEDPVSNSVCSSISLQLSQTMTMTRQAFRGTLTMFNGDQNASITDVKLNLEVRDESGNLATSHEFTVVLDSLVQFDGAMSIDAGWSLGAQQTGKAIIVFIPTKYAALDADQTYSFGGSLSYVDPATGLVITRDLYPVTLTVKPSPQLELTYFMQRDIYGDDPLTLDVVEPTVPAEFALLINNVGNGDATNVRMVTQQPKIIDNEKGLAVNFEIVSSQVNGGDAVLAFGQSIANDFGTIAAHKQAYGQWWLTSSLLGHFINYEVSATHVTSYGNPDLSLLAGDPTIHELIHSLEVADDENVMRGFLVNDVADAQDLPDMLYLTNGDVESVTVPAGVTVERTSATECLLTVTPDEVGWVYGSVTDPTHGLSTVKSVVRQGDGKELSAQNFWQTDRTLLDGKDWLYENRLHFADYIADGMQQTYVVTFEPAPETLLEVETIEGVPAEGTLATEPVDEVTLRFNKAVDPATFTTDDLTLAVQGTRQDVSLIGIDTADNTAFTLNLSALNEQLSNGYYVLTVNTADVTDHEGFLGRNGKQKGWVMYRGGLVQLLTSAYPANSGAVTRGETAPADGSRRQSPDGDDDTAAYGSTVVLTAQPAEGYEFSNWTLNGETVGTEPVYTGTALGDMNVVANFVKKKYMVTVTADETMGTVSGTGTGIYEHGTQPTLTAVPAPDYAFKEWVVDGEVVSFDAVLQLIIEKPTTVSAVFEREYYYQTLALSRGWNWVSTWLQESVDVTTLADNAYRILSQTTELFRDPELGIVGQLAELLPGQAYKIQAASTFNRTLRGHRSDLGEQTVGLQQGWNWMGYPSDTAAPLEAIANADDGDVVTAQTGFSSYDGTSWEGTLSGLTPGQGYLYKSAKAKELAFVPAASRGHGAYRAYRADEGGAAASVDAHRYPSTMSITARIRRDGTDLDGSLFTVYALTGSELRGVSQFVGQNHYLTVYGDEPVTLSFIVEENASGQQFAAAEELTFVSDVVGSRREPFAFTIGSTTGINVLDADTMPMTVYTLEGILVSRDASMRTLRQLPKGVYVVNGRKCFVK